MDGWMARGASGAEATGESRGGGGGGGREGGARARPPARSNGAAPTAAAPRLATATCARRARERRTDGRDRLTDRRTRPRHAPLD